jgi:hypothetical protein
MYFCNNICYLFCFQELSDVSNEGTVTVVVTPDRGELLYALTLTK